MTGVETGLNSPVYQDKWQKNGHQYLYNITNGTLVYVPLMLGLSYLFYWIWKSDLDMNDILAPFAEIFTAGGQAAGLLGVLGGLVGSVGNAAKTLKFW